MTFTLLFTSYWHIFHEERWRPWIANTSIWGYFTAIIPSLWGYYTAYLPYCLNRELSFLCFDCCLCISDTMLIYGLYPYSAILISYTCYLHPIYQEMGVLSSWIELPSTTSTISSSGASNPGPKESFYGERELNIL